MCSSDLDVNAKLSHKVSLEEHRRDEEITSGAKITPIREVMREMKKSGGIREIGRASCRERV